MQDAILNITQHKATPAQLEAGVVDWNVEDRKILNNLLTFKDLPSTEDLTARAEEILLFIQWRTSCATVIISGAPFFMSTLERVLKRDGFVVLHAFSERDSIEETDPKTGVVVKTNVFRHLGFIEV